MSAFVYEIKPSDVGKSPYSYTTEKTFRRALLQIGIPRILQADIGKRIYLVKGSFCIENAEQRDARKTP
jgi:hypothetical protein